MAGFPTALRELRQRRGLSLRELARQVNYSHTYLWELETGRKQVTAAAARALDSVLGGNGQLAALVVSPAVALVPTLPAQVGGLHDQLARAAQLAAREPAGPAAAQWAQLASWLYDTFVRRRPRFARLGPSRYSRTARVTTGLTPFRAEAMQQGRSPSTECRSVTRTVPPVDVAQRLGVDQGATVIRRENWYSADGEPMQVGVTYVPHSVGGTSALATTKRLGAGGLYRRLEDLGYPLHRIREEVYARMPTAEEASALGLVPGVPVLEVVHTSYDESRQPFEVTRFVVRADLGGLDYEMPVED